jgi:prevent-host-death family protein
MMAESPSVVPDELALSELDPQSRQLVERVLSTRRPLRITRGAGSAAVILDAAAYEQQQRRLSLMEHLAQGRRDLDEGRTMTQEQVEALMEEWLPDGE